MAPCCVCYEWYHKKFMKIPMNVFRSDGIGCGDVNLASRFKSLTTHMYEVIINNLANYLQFCKNMKTDSQISLFVSFFTLLYLIAEGGSISYFWEKSPRL